tara:strand:- start:152 stop:415 length:264 start_codon:yes stop_codon:yes gene_type:complete
MQVVLVVKLLVQQDHTVVAVVELRLQGLLELVQVHQVEQEQQQKLMVHLQLLVEVVEVENILIQALLQDQEVLAVVEQVVEDQIVHL